ncbi:hypothetical protein NC652_028694 [Populus alba x Populus x berolinensis]|nr:hypothetical protein NC652_028694 [Populus alba x Populus x berolinensis]
MFHLLGLCLSSSLSLSTYLLLIKCHGTACCDASFPPRLCYAGLGAFLANVWSPATKDFFACLGEALSPNTWPPSCWHGDLVYQICALLVVYVILSQGHLYLLPSYCFARA